jgi:hypothetical protein
VSRTITRHASSEDLEVALESGLPPARQLEFALQPEDLLLVLLRAIGVVVPGRVAGVVAVEGGLVVVAVMERRAHEDEVVGAQLCIDGGVDLCTVERGDCLLELLGQQRGAIALERESVERLPAPGSANQGIAIHGETIIDATLVDTPGTGWSLHGNQSPSAYCMVAAWQRSSTRVGSSFRTRASRRRS